MSDNGITVLVVEDEVFVRMDIVQFLEDEGFKVLEASNADDAILLSVPTLKSV
jgi:CheY-like chemotaxis protein